MDTLMVKKKVETARVPVGIPGFDKLVEGGLKRGSVNMLAGSAGSGKTIFAIQFLLEGIMNHKEPGIYITFEEHKEKIYEDMIVFGWDLAKLEKEGMFMFLEYSPEQVKKVITEGGGMIDTLIEKSKAKRIVIDSVTSFALLYQDELAKKEAALALFEMLNKWDVTALLTAQERHIDQDFLESNVEFEVESIIAMYHVKIRGLRRRAIEILKMRGTHIPNKTYAMHITQKCIVVDPNEVVVF